MTFLNAYSFGWARYHVLKKQQDFHGWILLFKENILEMPPITKSSSFSQYFVEN